MINKNLTLKQKILVCCALRGCSLEQLAKDVGTGHTTLVGIYNRPRIPRNKEIMANIERITRETSECFNRGFVITINDFINNKQ